ncbi:Replication-associated recombination protein A [Actinomyces bovis]|uniref:Replication-associated recombination protein A n=1 Tax=Actinomyces bovis TaxID=1658 RepID=A0ABY1VPY7_9ACTO|nr:replication-associated recombination protein A [Actinomyces bovis]SPT54065.1 Replication-associated recombination protein A [Actinomyces bovis]VEG53748.1 Replication-associated recombination protein A [Actinomyces israelii]
MDLFEALGTDDDGVPNNAHAPLAVRMRPKNLDEVLGQDHLLGAGSPLRRLVEPADDFQRGAGVSSVMLWGPPGTGKTTLAYLVARASGRRFVELSAVTAGVKDIRQVVSEARRRLVSSGEETVLFVDEVHRFTRTQQDSLLPGVENRWVTLVAATTENPSFSVVSPLLSRSLLLTLHPLEADAIRALLDRAVTDPRGLDRAVRLGEKAREQIVRMAGSDARKALTILEAAAGAVQTAVGQASGVIAEISLGDVERAADVAAVRYDRAGDQHYDVISAFIKSMRGSDPDATLHYLARMLAAGEDPRFVARRITIHAAEDVGLADPSVLSTAVAAQQAVALIGMPEARIVLAEAALAVATAPKSNSVIAGIESALADVHAGKSGVVPPHLRDAHYPGAKEQGHGVGYLYPHDYPHGVVAQEYLPETLRGVRYWRPSANGNERRLSERMQAVQAILRPTPAKDPEATGAAGKSGSDAPKESA